MKTLIKKKTVQPSIADRITEANALAGNARSLFATAANDLELSAQLKTELADDVEEVVADIATEISNLHEELDTQRGIQDDLDASAEADLASAAKIRELFAV